MTGSVKSGEEKVSMRTGSLLAMNRNRETRSCWRGLCCRVGTVSRSVASMLSTCMIMAL